jgi:serine/threonine protein kinase
MEREDFIAALQGAAKVLTDGTPERHCAQCRAPVQVSQTFCPDCGSLLRFACPQCRAVCLQGQAYCAQCGVKLTREIVDSSKAIQVAKEQAKRDQDLDLLDLFHEVNTLNQQRYLKLEGKRRDSGARRFLKKSKSETSRELLENEASILSASKHPHWSNLVETHRHRDQILLEFEYIETERLRFPLSIERLCRIMLQLAQALSVLHSRGLLHGDVKPQNVLLRSGSQPGTDELVLCDFELAQKPGPSRFKAMTPLFSAPEQIVGDHLDSRADVYAFGVMLYLWFIYDRLPSLVDEAPSFHETMGQILGSAPHSPGTPLAESTLVMDVDPRAWRVRRMGQTPSGEELLGAKYYFSAELERLANVNRRLDLTGDILQLVSDATEINRSIRPANGQALVDRLENILRKAQGPGAPPILTQDGAEEPNGTKAEDGQPGPRNGPKRMSAQSRSAGAGHGEGIDEPAAEGAFARKKLFKKRLRRVPRGWIEPAVWGNLVQSMPEHLGLRTGIVPRRNDTVERIRYSDEPFAVNLLLNEFEVLQTVHHPNLVALRCAKRWSPTLYVLTSWREPDRSLSPPFSLTWLLQRMMEAARGVAAVHRAGLVHGDLKPETILMGRSWTLVTDFKCAAPPGRRKQRLFTPKFAAPEQVLGEEVGPAADVYALGMTLYTLFIKERFPLLLRGARAPVTPEEFVNADEMPALSAATSFLPEPAWQEHGLVAGRKAEAAEPSEPNFMIGVKVRFRSRLDQVLEDARHAGLVREVLRVVRTATQLDPGERFRSCEEFESAVNGLLQRLQSAEDTEA